MSKFLLGFARGGVVGAVVGLLLLVVWLLFWYVPMKERSAFRIGYKQYEVYNYEMRDRYGSIGTFSKGWEDWEIDEILESDK